jgi:hypothetical protein
VDSEAGAGVGAGAVAGAADGDDDGDVDAHINVGVLRVDLSFFEPARYLATRQILENIKN